MKKTTRSAQASHVSEPRMILKFDTGADGFLKMIYVLAMTSVIVLIFGLAFLSLIKRELNFAI